MSDAEKCDQDVYEHGDVIMITGEATKTEIENLCRAIRPYLKDGIKLDWHYFGGRAVWKILDQSDHKTQEPESGVFAQNPRENHITKTD